MHRLPLRIVLLAIACPRPTPEAAAAPVEAFEVGAAQVDQLPKGKEADGIIGDFILRNDRIEALISGNLPNRKANMGTNWKSITPGCLYDLSSRGSGNDQLTCLAPGGLDGALSAVEVLPCGETGAGAIRARRTAARGGGFAQTHEYRLEEGWSHLVILSTYENQTSKEIKFNPEPAVKGLKDWTQFRGIYFGDAMDPTDRQGYACGAIDWPDAGAGLELRETALEPGKSLRSAIAVAPGRSPAEAFSAIARLKGPTGTLKAMLRDRSGAPAAEASLWITLETTSKKADDGTVAVTEKKLPAYAGPDGSLSVSLPAGTYAVAALDLGRPEVQGEVRIEAGKETEFAAELESPTRVEFAVTSEATGAWIPCKAQFLGIAGTPHPNLGVGIRAHGCDHQYHSETGRFTVRIPAGKYRVLVTHGIEFDHAEAFLDLKPGDLGQVKAALRRVVDTRGWISADYHNHSTPSGDNYCGTDDRIINLAAEQVEFAPTTEHNRLYDWMPHIRRLGLEKELFTVPGIELTGAGPHLNSFPLKPTPNLQDNGAPIWVDDPRINAINLRDFGPDGARPAERWVQLNHPAVGQYFRDRNNDGIPDGGFIGLENFIDAAEVWSAEILNFSPTYEVYNAEGKPVTIENRTFSWLQLLNQGRRIVCVAVSDAHAVFNSGVGGWRSYVPSSTDLPEKIDYQEIIRNSKAGRLLITNGPFIEARLADGTLAGGMARASGPIDLKVRVQATTWIDIDRVQVLVNGRARPDLNFTRKSHPRLFNDDWSRLDARKGALRFEASIPIALDQDAHLIAVAYGEKFNLAIGYGRSYQAEMHPCAYTNPMYVDVDGNGFQANGDTLGHPLPTGRK